MKLSIWLCLWCNQTNDCS